MTAHLRPPVSTLSPARHGQSVCPRPGELEILVNEEAENLGELWEEDEQVGVWRSALAREVGSLLSGGLHITVIRL
jgi:hypothetical protein